MGRIDSLALQDFEPRLSTPPQGAAPIPCTNWKQSAPFAKSASQVFQFLEDGSQGAVKAA